MKNISSPQRNCLTAKCSESCQSETALEKLQLEMPLKGLKKVGLRENHNPLVFSKHGFTASKVTEHDAVSDEE
ncbi:hypothetical protein TNCV_3500171 [Trichonephila clavipes]|nr:hypothetical protein TNCV_3500171 [Trichonephila clavipes]